MPYLCPFEDLENLVKVELIFFTSLFLYYLKKQIPFWTHFNVIYHILLVEIVERKSMYYVCL